MEYLKREFDRYKKGRKRAKSFERVNTLKAHAFQSLLWQTKDYLAPKSKILEVGFGSGYILALLAKENHEVYGIDTSQRALRYAKAVFKEKKVLGKLSIGSGFKIKYPDNYFDLVFNVGTIEHFLLKKQISFVKEMTRVSKKYVLISTPNSHPLSLYQKFKKSIKYCPETENLTNLIWMCKKIKLKPIKLSGFQIIADKHTYDEEIKKFYKKHQVNLLKKEWKVRDLKKLIKIEKQFSNKVLYERGFLVYVLAKKD
ncbi:class I SAM-dependent methyltransferase [Candidatus Woesearchaeota archaeon]|nr:class I SAM-dependent methyltransferase [Candidatus Woesearchaeota archaeon]